ncbi:HAMP domain-containing protein [bacterium]|nr:HAMP domain-containing protein [bacterium]
MVKKTRKRFSVRQKIQLPIILFIALLSLFMFAYFPTEHEEALRDSFHNEVQSLAQMVATSVTFGLASEDWAGMRRTLDIVVRAPGVRFAALVDRQGRTFAAHKEDFEYTPAYEQTDSLVVAFYPVETDLFSGSAVIGASTDFISDRVHKLGAITFWVSMITLLLGTLFGMWQANLIVRPLSLLRLAAIKVGHGDLDTAVYRYTNDEIGDLATEFGKMIANVRSAQQHAQEVNTELQSKNRLLEAERRQLARTLEHLKATQAQLVQSEKMAALGQLIAGIAHEINTPLGAIRASISNIDKALEHTLRDLPALLASLEEEVQEQFFSMVRHSLSLKTSLSAREERKKRRALQTELENDSYEFAAEIADNLSEMGIFRGWDIFDDVLRHERVREILTLASRLSMQQRNSQNIELAVERASKIVFALKNFSHHDKSGEMSHADIVEGIETVLTLYHNQLKHGVEVTRHFESVPAIRCYPDELNQVWTNLIHNAIQAMEYEGQLEVSVRTVGQGIEVAITDDGSGIPEDIQAKIFEPFFTTKEAGEGSGLGLDIVRRIVDKHHGNIRVESKPGKTTFTVLLPLHPELEASASGDAATGAAGSGHKGSDDPAGRQSDSGESKVS